MNDATHLTQLSTSASHLSPLAMPYIAFFLFSRLLVLAFTSAGPLDCITGNSSFNICTSSLLISWLVFLVFLCADRSVCDGARRGQDTGELGGDPVD